jgi:hypothetical protein
VTTPLAHPEGGARGVLIYTRINLHQIGGGGSSCKKETSQIRTTEHIATGLRHTREALGVNQREFVRRVYLKSNRYSQYESEDRLKCDFFIDRLMILVNNFSFENAHRGEKQWISMTMAK